MQRSVETKLKNFKLNVCMIAFHMVSLKGILINSGAVACASVRLKLCSASHI